MLSSFGIETTMGLIPIHLYLQKLSSRAQLRVHILLHNYILCSLLKSRLNLYNNQHWLSLDSLTLCQWEKIRDPIIDMNNRFNEVFLSFNLYNFEFSSSSRFINIFSSHFSFHSFSKYSKDNLISCSWQLDNLVIMSSEDSSYTLVITNGSIKNDVAISIVYIYICNKLIVKTLYYTVNITSTEAKLFTIRYSINQATNI